MATPATTNPSKDRLDQEQFFRDAYATIKAEILEDFASEGMPPESIRWYERNIDYNLPGGKLNRGLAILDTIGCLKKGGAGPTESDRFKAAVLGWCVELIQAYFLVLDDLTDGSITRRGQPCYYHVVGNISINDACLLKSAVFVLLRKHFSQEPYYVHLLDIVNDTICKTEMGQLLDTITSTDQKSDRYDLNNFSLEKHRTIVVYKTAFYSFYLPVALAMLICGIPMPSPYSSVSTTVNPYKQALDILLPMGEYFQVQDDYLDAFSPPQILGKVGTDIIDGKCSWCICMALSLATPAQRQVLNENYGTGVLGSPEELRVKRVYEEVALQDKYAEYEEAYRTRFIEALESIDDSGPLRREVFTKFFDKIYKRQK